MAWNTVRPGSVLAGGSAGFPSNALLGFGLGLLGRQGSWQNAMQGFLAGSNADSQQATRDLQMEEIRQKHQDRIQKQNTQAHVQSQLLGFSSPGWTNPDTGTQSSPGTLAQMGLDAPHETLARALIQSGQFDKLSGLLPKPAEPFTLSPGAQRFGPNNQVVAQVPFKPDGPQSSVGKLEGDLKAGLISPGDYKAALRKETYIAPNYGPPLMVTMGPGGPVYTPRPDAAGMAAPPRSTAGSRPLVSTFYDDQTGQAYRAQWNPDTKNWEQIGGLKQSGGGGITQAQQRVNAEVDAARQQLQGLPKDQILQRSQQMLPNGLPNPDYDPYTATLVRRATSRKTGDDPQFEGVYSNFYGNGQPAQAMPQGAAPQQQGAARPPGMSDGQILLQAKQALASGKDPAAIAQRLRQWGLDPSKAQ